MTNVPPVRSSPYQGLIPFSEEDAPFFFGREKEIRLIIANLFASNLTILYGASGVGKSSILRAGVAHRLSQRDDVVGVVFSSWQGNPLNDLKNGIREAVPQTHNPVRFPQSSDTLSSYLASLSEQLDVRIMVILDQFEEYFLYHPHDEPFVEDFSNAVAQTRAPITFLISIREDFYTSLDRFEESIPALHDNNLRIEHLDLISARQAIEKPIAQHNLGLDENNTVSIEPELVDMVLSEIATGRVIVGSAEGTVTTIKESDDNAGPTIETPFLQLVMTRLWDEETRVDSRRLHSKTLVSLGGADSIVRTHLDVVMSTLTSEEQQTAAIMFRYLVTPSGTKIAYSISDLAEVARLDPGKIDDVIQKLSRREVRILRRLDVSAARPGGARYEIFHDVLAPAILDWQGRRARAQLALQKLETLNELDQQIARRIFNALVTPSGKRNSVALWALAGRVNLPIVQVERVVGQLTDLDAGILRVEQRRDHRWYELSHDLLVTTTDGWLRSHPRQEISYLSTTARNLLATYPFALGIVLIYGLACFWPSTGPDLAINDSRPAGFLLARISVSEEGRLLIIVILAAALGGLGRSAYLFDGPIRRNLLLTKRIYDYVLLPFVGAAISVILYYLLRVGFLSAGATARAINPFGMAAMAFLTGLYSRQAMNRLSDIARTLFTPVATNKADASRD